MSENSPNLVLPYIMPSQAQKHVTHNEAIRMLDALVHLSVRSVGATEPPATNADGDRHIVGTGATAQWASHDGELAAFQDGAWMFYTPRAGFRAHVQDQPGILLFDGAAWTPLETDLPSGTFQNLDGVGIATSSDATNRLAVSSDATLLNHAGGGHQLKLNKSAPGDTASLLFQTGFSGRAEMGTAGDDNFAIKVSADGASWTTGLSIDASNGTATTGQLTISDSAPSLTFDHPAATKNWQVGMGADDSFFISKSDGGFGTGGRVLQFDGNGGLGLWNLPSSAAMISVSTNINSQAQDRVLEITQIAASTATGVVRFINNAGNATPVLEVQGGGVDVFKVQANGYSTFGGPARLKSYTVSTVPNAAAAAAAALIYVSDESGGAVPAFSDGTNWRRCSDRAIIS